MKILFISHHPKFRCTIRTAGLAERLAARGHHVTVLCTRDTGLIRIHESDEGGVHYVETPDLLPGRLRSGWDPWDALHRWFYLRGNFDFDLVHALETRPVTIHPLRRALRRKKIPLVIDWIDWWGRGGIITTNRPGWYQVLFGGIETFYEEHFRTMADATTVICSGLGRRAEGLGVRPESIFKIVLGADTENIPFVPPCTYRAEFGLDDADQIAFFSALYGMMDVEMVFDAARNVALSHPRFKLVMTGNHAARLTKHAQDKGLSGRFIHLGMLPRDRFGKALACADLFLLPFADKPYNHGRWPSKIGDYLSAGRPIVSNPIGEVQTILTQHPAGVLTAFTPESFAEGIRSILDRPDQAGQMQKAARRTAETDLRWDCIIDELEKAYRYAVTCAAQKC